MHPLLAWPYAAAAVTAEALTHTRLPGQSKLARALRARRGLVARFERWGAAHRDATRPLVWIHAPSVGEGLQARPVIERLRAHRPDVQIVYTFYSPSAEQFAASLAVDLADYLPFDRASSARRLLAALRPTALVFAKLDLWPFLAAAARAQGVPVGMISATVSEGSGRRGPVARAFLREAYTGLAAVGAIDDADADRLAALGVPREHIVVTGDTRYDQVAARAATTAATAPTSPLLAPLASTRPTLVAGSTWPADERVLFPAWLALRRDVSDARLVIAPHEPTTRHVAAIRRWAAASGLSLAALGEATAAHDVVLVDRLGVLGELYTLADVAFVGGGFHAAGLHSVLEPAAFGTPVVFGPRHANSRDARLLIACRGGESVGDAKSLARALEIVMTEPDTRAHAGAAARALVQEGLGAAERSAELVEGLM